MSKLTIRARELPDDELLFLKKAMQYFYIECCKVLDKNYDQVFYNYRQSVHLILNYIDAPPEMTNITARVLSGVPGIEARIRMVSNLLIAQGVVMSMRVGLGMYLLERPEDEFMENNNGYEKLKEIVALLNHN